jgi:hypothetical protein
MAASLAAHTASTTQGSVDKAMWDLRFLHESLDVDHAVTREQGGEHRSVFTRVAICASARR